MNNMGLTTALLILSAAISSFAAWITHIVFCISAITSAGGNVLGGVAMLLFGVLVPPLGVIHGWMIWFGAGLF